MNVCWTPPSSRPLSSSKTHVDLWEAKLKLLEAHTPYLSLSLPFLGRHGRIYYSNHNSFQKSWSLPVVATKLHSVEMPLPFLFNALIQIVFVSGCGLVKLSCTYLFN